MNEYPILERNKQGKVVAGTFIIRGTKNELRIYLGKDTGKKPGDEVFIRFRTRYKYNPIENQLFEEDECGL